MTVIDWIVDKFSSIRFTIAVCILLAAVSFLGTVVPQNRSPQEYSAMYGEVLGPLATGLGIDDLYHSWGFILLLCVLSVNLMACTWKRFPAVWRSLRREVAVPSDTEFRGWRSRDSFCLERSGDGWAEGLPDALARVLGRCSLKSVGSCGERVFLFEKYRFSRVGPSLVHVSILIILGGALVGALFGFKGTLVLPEGATDNLVRLSRGHEQHALDFQIRCNRFVVDLYPNGTPREYRSEVSLLDESGQEVIREAVIRVNHPLTFRGITFYQSTYGDLSTLVLDVREREGGKQARVETEIRTPFPLPGEAGDRAWALKFTENMKIPSQMVERSKFMKENLGPAVQVGIFSTEGGFGDPFWVLKDYPEIEDAREGKYHFTLEAFRSIPYTGLQVAFDPGTPLVWTGCSFLIIGFFISFLLDHETLWVSAKEREDGRVIVRVAGRVVRHPGAYAARFEKRKAGIRKALGVT